MKGTPRFEDPERVGLEMWVSRLHINNKYECLLIISMNAVIKQAWGITPTERNLCQSRASDRTRRARPCT